MKPRIPKLADRKTPESIDGETRPPDAPLNEAAIESDGEVQPTGFKEPPSSSIEAAAVDCAIDDSEGGESVGRQNP